jgi:gliding motility-associated protein GldL
MITEICVFVISAFDRPVKDYNWEEVFPVLASNNPADRPDFSSATEITDKSTVRSARQKSPQVSVSHPVDLSGAADSVESDNHVIGSLDAVAENVQKFAEATETLTRISESLQESYRYIIDHSQEIGQNSLGYVQQMEALNRNISGLNTIYEIQLHSISGQIETIDQINAGLLRVKTLYNDSIPDGSIIKQETEKMAAQLRELNSIYARMIEAMTGNLNRQNPA